MALGANDTWIGHACPGLSGFLHRNGSRRNANSAASAPLSATANPRGAGPRLVRVTVNSGPETRLICTVPKSSAAGASPTVDVVAGPNRVLRWSVDGCERDGCRGSAAFALIL